MPRHYAVGSNVQEYTVQFNNTKSAVIQFVYTFSKKPIVQMTLRDSANVPPYKAIVTTSYATIRFKTPYSGSLDVMVLERD